MRIIETERLIIREFNGDDWESVYSYTSDSLVMKYMPEGVFTEEAAKEFVKKNSSIDARSYPVVLKSESKVIGHVVFHKWFGDHTYEIGWVFNSKYHNKGFASEAAKAVLKYAFEDMRIHRVISTCQPENPPSYRVMEKIGMRREGYFVKCIPKGNEWWDEYYYAILDEEWYGNKLDSPL